MAQQNIYDNEIFFSGYKKIRDNKVNANNLFEIPALFSMMPKLEGKRVLDLGCGFGEHCKQCVDYGVEGERESVWFVDNVKKYHRTFSTIINTLIEAGFTIEKMIEPLPTDELLEKYPDYKDLFHKPDFLLIKAKNNYCERTVKFEKRGKK